MVKEKEEMKEKVREDFIIPSVDIYEDEENFYVKAEMPGVSKDNLDVTLEDEHLEIIGKVDTAWEENYRIIDKEYRMSDYYRRFNVGNKVDPDKVKAKIENGILTLTLGKSNEIKPRKIEISSE